jgi:SAM-dependent methyltransferase
VCGASFGKSRHHWLFRCGTCGLLASTLTPEIPSEIQSTPIDEDRRASALAHIRRRNNAIILNHIGRLLDPHSRELLDVGSGLGFFLGDATSRGFHVSGIEPDATVVEIARSTGAATRHGYFPDCLGSEEMFDAVVFNDVLEHIPALTATMDACSRHLRPNGLLVVNFPNQRGFFYRVANFLNRLGVSGPLDRMWQRGLASPHVWYFEPAHLAQLGQQYDLALVSQIELSPLTWRGLTDRVFYVRGQSKLIGALTVIGSAFILPFLSLLPRDIAIVILQKKAALV